MSKNKPIQISIPQPCNEDWNKMTSREQGRFCDSCQKTVIDFTEFNDHQLYEYINAHKDEKVCGRFQNTQLNRTLNIPPQPHSRLYRIAIAVGLTLAIMSTAEVNSFAKAPLVEYKILDAAVEDSVVDNKSGEISGVITDKNGEPIINASIQVIDSNGIIRAGTVTNYDGYYKLTITKPRGRYSVEANYTGYQKNVTTNILAKPNKSSIVNIKLATLNELEEVEVIIYTVGAIFCEPDDNIAPGILNYTIDKPLIDTLNPSPMNKTITSDEIDKMPY